MKPFRFVLRLIAIVQCSLGTSFLLAPGPTARLLGLTPDAPGWTNWLFAMMAARFLGYGYGMWRASQQPEAALSWIDSMVGVQAMDWIGTVVYLLRGEVTLRQVTTASFLPLVFIGALLWWHPRRRPALAVASGGAAGR